MPWQPLPGTDDIHGHWRAANKKRSAAFDAEWFDASHSALLKQVEAIKRRRVAWLACLHSLLAAHERGTKYIHNAHFDAVLQTSTCNRKWKKYEIFTIGWKLTKISKISLRNFHSFLLSITDSTHDYEMALLQLHPRRVLHFTQLNPRCGGYSDQYKCNHACITE